MKRSPRRLNAFRMLVAGAEIEERRSEMAESDDDRIDASGTADVRLLHRLRQRDEAALAEVLERCGAELARVAWLLLGDRDAVEEVVQQTLIAAWEGAGRTSPETTLRAWLMGILVRRSREWQRREARRRRHESRAWEWRAEQVSSPPVARSERLAEVRAAIRALPRRLREVVVLHYDEGMRIAEVAEALGLPVGTVKSRLRRAFQLLRKELG